MIVSGSTGCEEGYNEKSKSIGVHRRELQDEKIVGVHAWAGLHDIFHGFGCGVFRSNSFSSIGFVNQRYGTTLTPAPTLTPARAPWY
jgi:hypothetical protein